MKYQELIILLPCHSLEDFPTHHLGDEAEGLLAAWSALWHPALIAAADSTPNWHRIDDPPDQVGNRLVVVPAVGTAELPTGFAQRVKDENGCLIRRKSNRDEVLAAALEPLDGGDGGSDPELVADFLALGYAYLQVQLLTRQMRYASNLDETYFRNQVVQGAHAVLRHDADEAGRKLTACFDVLAQERDHFYSVDVFLVDITLVAPTTLAPLAQELNAGMPVNLLLNGALLETISQQHPDLLSQLRQAIDAGTAGVVGGERFERCLPSLSNESVLAELRRGQAVYEQLLGQPLQVYGRRRFGLTSVLPSILQKLDFQGALHATFEEGHFPEGAQVKTRWEAADGAGIDAIARTPLDANKPETFLALAMKMGESMDMDHVATLCLAHWPGHTSPWYQDLRRIARYGNVLGRFVTVEHYFRDTVYPGQTDRFEAHQYRSPYLKQAVIRKQPDPLSTWVRYWRRLGTMQAAEAMDTLARLLAKDPSLPQSELREWIDQATEPETGPADLSDEQLDSRLQAQFDDAAARLKALFTKPGTGSEPAYLVLNPANSVRRLAVETSQFPHLPAIERPIYATGETADGKHVVVDVPPMGFAYIQAGEKPKPPKRVAPNLAEELMLRNEFMEVHFDPTTGAIRAVHDYNSRSNRMSQQLALRLSGPGAKGGGAWQDPDGAAQYSVMAADSIEVTAANSVMGEVTVRGRLLDRDGKNLAGFCQISRLRRGSRLLYLDIELDPQADLSSDPWNSYYACRVAWNDESSDVWRTVNNVRQPAGAKRFEAPQYIEVESGEQRLTIFTGGLPYHRRQGLRVVDTLLIVRGERMRQFQLAIGLDVAYPMAEAVHFLTPAVVLPVHGVVPHGPSSAWLVHVDAKNIVATHWSPLVEEGRLVGLRVRLQETAGRLARATLSTFRSLAKARQVDFRGLPLGECAINDGAARVELAAHEWVEIEAWFA